MPAHDEIVAGSPAPGTCPGHPPSQPGPDLDVTAPAALAALAAALSPRGFVTVLTTGQGRSPRLTVTARCMLSTGEITCDVYVLDGWYLWGPSGRIAAARAPRAAAAVIARHLNYAPAGPDA